jgi:CheY-like chemotaxis protein
MPDKDGYELLAELGKLLGDLHKIPAVALTGFASARTGHGPCVRVPCAFQPFDMEALCILVLQLVQRARR